LLKAGKQVQSLKQTYSRDLLYAKPENSVPDTKILPRSPNVESSQRFYNITMSEASVHHVSKRLDKGQKNTRIAKSQGMVSYWKKGGKLWKV